MNLRQSLLPMGAVALLVTELFASSETLDENCGELVNSLGTFSTSSSFSVLGAGALSVTDFQNVGPRFTLTENTVITQIGAIVNSSLPLTVDIYASLNGVPDVSSVLASFELSNDGDPAVFSFESVQANLVLGPGEYFALFAPQPGDAGAILSAHSGLQAESFLSGLFNSITGTAQASEDVGAVRILACAKIGPPVTKEECKSGGWRNFNFPRSFRNQGDCIQFVNTHGTR